MLSKFQCLHCAQCCTGTGFIKSVKEKRELQTSRDLLAQRRGLCWNVPDHILCLPLFNDELAVLKERAGEHDIEFRPIPLLYIIDEITNNVVVLCWTMDHIACPFLSHDDKNPRCIVHDVKPLICRAFPVVRLHNVFSAYVFSEICKGTLCNKKNRIRLQLEDTTELQAALAIDQRMNELYDMLEQLQVKQQIRPRLMTNIENVNLMAQQQILTGKYATIEEIFIERKLIN